MFFGLNFKVSWVVKFRVKVGLVTLNWGERARGNDWSGSVEWYQIRQIHGFQVFDAIPFAPLQLL